MNAVEWLTVPHISMHLSISQPASLFCSCSCSWSCSCFRYTCNSLFKSQSQRTTHSYSDTLSSTLELLTAMYSFFSLFTRCLCTKRLSAGKKSQACIQEHGIHEHYINECDHKKCVSPYGWCGAVRLKMLAVFFFFHGINDHYCSFLFHFYEFFTNTFSLSLSHFISFDLLTHIGMKHFSMYITTKYSSIFNVQFSSVQIMRKLRK